MSNNTPSQLQELGDFLSPVLAVPVGDKTYRFKAMSAQNALFVEGVMHAAQNQIDGGESLESVIIESDEDTTAYMHRVLGDTYDELLDDGISMPAIKHLLAIVMAWTFRDLKSAQEYYNLGGKAPEPNRAERRTATKTRTAAATTTRKPASQSITRTRKTTTKAAPGTKSSATGTPSKPTSKTSA